MTSDTLAVPAVAESPASRVAEAPALADHRTKIVGADLADIRIKSRSPVLSTHGRRSKYTPSQQ